MARNALLKRIFAVALILLYPLPMLAYASPEDYNSSMPALLTRDHLYSQAAILIDAGNGDVLFDKNADSRIEPASTTKIMTLLLAVESGWGFDVPVQIPAEAMQVPPDSSLIPVYKGETTTFGDLLYGMMLHSGNDGANAVAVLLAGSLDAFVSRMNARAAALGCTGTHFANAHGYHDPNHYSTARDLARITQEAMKHSEVREIVATPSYTMHMIPEREVPLRTTDSLIIPSSAYYYKDAIGVKTGTHSAAGRCFVGAAEKDGAMIISVTLKAETDDEKWVDTKRLFEYGFAQFTPYTLSEMFSLTSGRIVNTRISNAKRDDPYGGLLDLELALISDPDYLRLVRTSDDTSLLSALDDFSRRVEISIEDHLTAPISKGNYLGSFRYTAQDGTVITAALIAARDIEAEPERVTLFDLLPMLRIFKNRIVQLLFIVLLLIVLLLYIHSTLQKRRRQRRRKELYRQRRRAYYEQSRTKPSTRTPRKHYSSDENLFGKF